MRIHYSRNDNTVAFDHVRLRNSFSAVPHIPAVVWQNYFVGSFKVRNTFQQSRCFKRGASCLQYISRDEECHSYTVQGAEWEKHKTELQTSEKPSVDAHIYICFCFVWVWHLVAHIEGGT